MASLNLSTNGPSINQSYQAIVNSGPPASSSAASSPTYGQWAVFSVQAPLANAFQQDSGGKESVLKVQSTGEGELLDLIDEFSDGRVQFAFVKVKDSNTGLPKFALIAWCGEGVPERTKGYFTSHLNAVAKVLHGYHVQITARSDRDLTPDGIVQKIADASGSKYSAGSANPASKSAGPPPVASKPVFTPSQSSGSSGFNPIARRAPAPKPANVDQDGWGDDAPPITRTQLQKVQSAYQPTQVNMRDLSSKQEPSRFDAPASQSENPDVVKGAYQPVGKVDIAAIRRQAQGGGNTSDDRPTTVKGAYEPVGKVDIAAIRARAQQPSESASSPPSGPSATSEEPAKPVSSGYTGGERLTSLPKPKVANKFGGGGFTGTKPPAPGGFGLESKGAAPTPSGPRSFQDGAGKTPAQLWAEKKAQQGGAPAPASVGGPVAPQTSGNEGWKSGYAGKSWATVQTTRTGQSAGSVERQTTGQEEPEAEESIGGGVSALKDRFKGAAPMGAAASGSDRSAPEPPPLATLTKPNAGGVAMPGLPSRPAEEEEVEPPRLPTPPQQPRSPTPPAIEPGSPIRVAMPVSGNEPEIQDAHDEQRSPPPSMPLPSLAKQVSQRDDEDDEPETVDPARAAGTAAAASTFGQAAVAPAHATQSGGKRAQIQYDYAKGEDNEIDLVEGEYVTNIDMVDEDWWMGQNSQGQSGLFPSNYVELVDDDDGAAGQAAPAQPDPVPAAGPPGGSTSGTTATALYDYEAAEDNEISFPEDAKITDIQFPDEDWWSGVYKGKEGLFPANYVQLDQ